MTTFGSVRCVGTEAAKGALGAAIKTAEQECAHDGPPSPPGLLAVPAAPALDRRDRHTKLFSCPAKGSTVVHHATGKPQPPVGVSEHYRET